MAAPFTYVDNRLVYKQNNNKKIVLGFVRNPPVGEDMAEALNRILQDELQNTLPLTNTIKVPKGCVLITEERRKQLKKYGVELDDANYPNGELVEIVKRLLDKASPRLFLEANSAWDKVISKPYNARLIIAGALIAAELDRLSYSEVVTHCVGTNYRAENGKEYALLKFNETNLVGLVPYPMAGDSVEVKMIHVANTAKITSEEFGRITDLKLTKL